ncbi:MAG: glycoside hydrolase family 18 protein [Chitinophagaceae bacterium]|nr:glycoside hydrolase family 18 protein [Chitinophagaceae bacterium]
MRFIVIILLIFSSSLVYGQRHYKVIAYISGDSLITSSNIEAKKITHLHYTFATVSKGEIAEGINDSINLLQLNRLKVIRPNLKVLIAVGGENGSAGFSEAVASDSSRLKFAQSIVSYIKKYQLDGVEIHWELKPRGMFGNAFNPKDQENLVLLLEVLRAKLDAQSKAESRKKKNKYLLSMTGSSKRQYLFRSKLNVAHQCLDYITLQTFDYKVQILNAAGISGTLVTCHHSNLYPSRTDSWMRLSVDKTVREYVNHNIPSRKLVMGIAFYGKGWNNAYEDYNGLYQWAESKVTDDLSYKSIATHYVDQPDYQKLWDKQAKARYLYNNKNGVFISYDDKKTIRKKTLYIRRHRLGGAVFGDYRQDNGTLLNPLKNGLRYFRLPFILF